MSFPVIDHLNLKVGVSTVNTKEAFKYITRVIFSVHWATATLLFSTFGVDAALTNGIQLKYNEYPILQVPIKDNNDFADIAYDTRIDSDFTATKLRHLVSRLSFTKFTEGELGLLIERGKKFQVLVQDDLSDSSNSEIELVVEGWRPL